MPPRPLKGRPPKYVKSPTGKPVVGLSKDANGYYYTFWRSEGFDKRPNFGPLWDYEGVLSRFREWQLQRGNKVVTLEFAEPYNDESSSILEHVRRKTYTKEEVDVLNELRRDAGMPEKEYPIGEKKEWQTIFELEIGEAAYWQKMRSSLLEDLDKAKEKTGLNIILKDPPPPESKASLSSLLQFYLEHASPHPAEARGCRNAWDYFSKIVGKKNINDVSDEDISKVYLETNKSLRSEAKSPDWVKKKYSRIKTILKLNAEVNAKARKECKRVLGLCSVLRSPRVPAEHRQEGSL